MSKVQTNGPSYSLLEHKEDDGTEVNCCFGPLERNCAEIRFAQMLKSSLVSPALSAITGQPRLILRDQFAMQRVREFQADDIRG